MMKKQIAVIMMVMLCLFSVIPVSAKTNKNHPIRFVDDADLVPEQEEEDILEKLDELSEKWKTDVVIVTTNSLEGKSAMEYADDYYDYNGYGIGSGKDGVLLLVSMKDRDWYISTTGFGRVAFTDEGLEYIGDRLLPHLSKGDYTKAFSTYTELCANFIRKAKTGDAYSATNLPRGEFSIKYLFISIGIGLVIACIVVFYLVSQLKSVRRQKTANSYVRPGSMHMKDSRDMYLYRTLNRREKPKNNDSNPSSSSHVGSSGERHGGTGGKF